MKRWVFIISVVWASAVVVFGAINVPSDGSDEVLHITQNTEIDLSLAVTGNWDANNAAHAGRGIYDPDKWAVVFKYSSVTVDAGTNVTFKNHPSRAPVVWLVSGDVTINGTVSLNGQDHLASPTLAEPGPGGFRGGQGLFSAAWNLGAGFGSGGGSWNYAGGSFGTTGSSGQPVYGNPSLLPLIGGSGGGGGCGIGNYATRNSSGGGGGGAFFVASRGTISINGKISADGGSGRSDYASSSTWARSGGGSGGGIRLVADTLTGNGIVQANGGSAYRSGGMGRIRIERMADIGSLDVVPSPSVIEFESGATPLIWLPNDGPTVRIVSVGGDSAPADPRASLETQMPDVQLPQTTSAQVVIETVNVEEVSTVQLRVTPRGNANFTTVNATLDEVVNTSPLTIRWVATAPLNAGSSALQVRVVRP